MTTPSTIRKQLLSFKTSTADDAKRFFKTGPGDYAAHDQFLGIPVPALRKIAKTHCSLPIETIQQLLHSKLNEERLLALLILIDRYQKNEKERSFLYNFYLKNTQHINNWNLVDASAHHIVGAHLFPKQSRMLTTLAKSNHLWERRIAIVATWYFIRHDQYEATIKIATILLKDSHDLIHKSVGWMLREMGKRNQHYLIDFLDQHASIMPRTMLRYAIEKLPADLRDFYVAL